MADLTTPEALAAARALCEAGGIEDAYGRLVDNAFGGHEARLSIPARPDHDDDLVVGRWLREARTGWPAALDEIGRQAPLLGRCRVVVDELAELLGGCSDAELDDTAAAVERRLVALSRELGGDDE